MRARIHAAVRRTQARVVTSLVRVCVLSMMHIRPDCIVHTNVQCVSFDRSFALNFTVHFASGVYIILLCIQTPIAVAQVDIYSGWPYASRSLDSAVGSSNVCTVHIDTFCITILLLFKSQRSQRSRMGGTTFVVCYVCVCVWGVFMHINTIVACVRFSLAANRYVGRSTTPLPYP